MKIIKQNYFKLKTKNYDIKKQILFFKSNKF